MQLDLGGLSEVAKRLGVSKSRAVRLARTDDFPTPIATLDMGSVWNMVDIDRWRESARPGPTDGVPCVPPRDAQHPQHDPWDADALRYLLRCTDGSRTWSWWLRHLRGHPGVSLEASSTAQAQARRLGVRCHPDPGGTTVHFFRTDDGAPKHYPRSDQERRNLRAQDRYRQMKARES